MSEQTSAGILSAPDPRERQAAPAGPPLQQLEEAVADVLTAAGIHDIGAYGWLNENDADPELVGHAMWQVDQPLSRTAMDPFGEQPVLERPSERDKHVLVAGEDFCGMMRLARLTIGLALLWREHRADDLFGEQSYFWLQHTDAVLKLAIASDRLRDVLVVASTSDSVEAYEKPDWKLRAYVAPFNTVRQLLQARGKVHPSADTAIAALPTLATQIHANIKGRNQAVHEIATRLGRMTRDRVEALQSRYDRERKPSAFRPMPEIRDLREVERELRAERDAAATAITDWYTLLVKTSNYVFQIEYWSRVKTDLTTPGTE